MYPSASATRYASEMRRRINVHGDVSAPALEPGSCSLGRYRLIGHDSAAAGWAACGRSTDDAGQPLRAQVSGVGHDADRRRDEAVRARGQRASACSITRTSSPPSTCSSRPASVPRDGARRRARTLDEGARQRADAAAPRARDRAPDPRRRRPRARPRPRAPRSQAREHHARRHGRLGAREDRRLRARQAHRRRRGRDGRRAS